MSDYCIGIMTTEMEILHCENCGEVDSLRSRLAEAEAERDEAKARLEASMEADRLWSEEFDKDDDPQAATIRVLKRERDAILLFLRHQSAMKLPGEHDVVRSLALQKAADQIEAGYHLDDGTTKSAALSK